MLNNKFCLVGIDNDFIDLIEEKPSSFLGYFSENKKFYSYIDKKKRLGNHTHYDWLKFKKKYNPDIILTIDDGVMRKKIYKLIYKKNCKNLFFRNSFISKSTKKYLKTKQAIIIQKFVRIMPNVKIGNGVKINIGAQIHHDCLINDFATIAPKALLLGNVQVGECSYIGANSTIRQNIKIGKGAVVGAGSVVVKNVNNYDVVAGVPARSIKK